MNRYSHKILILIGLSLAVISIYSCGDKKTSSSNSTNAAVVNTSDLVKIKMGEPVTLNSPAVFIQVWILFNMQQKEWAKELDSLPKDTDPEVFLANKRAEFYKSLGLTEQQFTQYSNNHFGDISHFLDQNPDYKTAYEQSAE